MALHAFRFIGSSTPVTRLVVERIIPFPGTAIRIRILNEVNVIQTHAPFSTEDSHKKIDFTQGSWTRFLHRNECGIPVSSKERVADFSSRNLSHRCLFQPQCGIFQENSRSRSFSGIAPSSLELSDETSGSTSGHVSSQIDGETTGSSIASPSKANRKTMREIIKNAKAGLGFKVEGQTLSRPSRPIQKNASAINDDESLGLRREARVGEAEKMRDKPKKKVVAKLSKTGKRERVKEDEMALDSLVTAVLVGRPNVGKSALFNRLTQRREALVYDTPDSHVTRDHRQGVAKIGDLRLRIFDTAGLEPSAEPESILSRTGKLTQNVLSKCHLALFLLDGRVGLHPRDSEIATWLRKVAPHVHVLLVVNKCEGLGGDPRGLLPAVLGEAQGLGWGEGVPVSAETGEGLSDLYERLAPLVEERQELADTDPEEEPSFCHVAPGESPEVGPASVADDRSLPLQLAICGRPNVGKSTLLNNLVGEERALTGPEPGLTRDAVCEKFRYKGREIALVDTAGWLHRSEQGEESLAAMDAKRRLMKAHVVALVLDAGDILDARCTLKRSEMGLARWVVLEGRALVVIVNKVDKLREGEWAEEREALGKKMATAVPEEIHAALPQVGQVPIIFMSALTGNALEKVMPIVEESYRNWCTRLSTAHLNKWLEKVLARSPRKSGHGGKIRYLTQAKARPPTFIAFTNGAEEVPETDMRFIGAALREDFKLPGIPVRVFQRYTKKSKASA